MESEKNCQLWLWPGDANTTRQQTKILTEWLCIILKTLKNRKKSSGSVDIKLKRPLMIEFCLIKDICDNLRVSAIIMCVNKFKDLTNPFKGIKDNHSRVHPQRERVPYWRITRLVAIKMRMKKMAGSYHFLQDGMPLARAESKQSRRWSWNQYFQAGVEQSRLKVTDSAALVLTNIILSSLAYQSYHKMLF